MMVYFTMEIAGVCEKRCGRCADARLLARMSQTAGPCGALAIDRDGIHAAEQSAKRRTRCLRAEVTRGKGRLTEPYVVEVTMHEEDE